MENKTIYIVLDNVRYNNNLGPIYRIADNFDIKKLYVCRKGQDKFKQKKLDMLNKASRGAINFVNWELRNNTEDVIKELKAQKVKIVAIDIKTETLLKEAVHQQTYPLALVFGTESVGVNPEILDLADEILKIPMTGKTPSLNVSSAVAIVCYTFRYS
jgi:tRNA G18 (ribose-2'-O)-methylase SpoU